MISHLLELIANGHLPVLDSHAVIGFDVEAVRRHELMT